MCDPLFRHRYKDGEFKVAILRSYDRDVGFDDDQVCVGAGYDFGKSPYDQPEELVFSVGSNQAVIEIPEKAAFVVYLRAKRGTLLRGGLAEVRSSPFSSFEAADGYREAVLDQPNAASADIRMIQIRDKTWECTQD